jgi:hypothetical protein
MDKQISVFTDYFELQAEYSKISGGFMIRLIELDENLQKKNQIEICSTIEEVKGIIKALEQILPEN